MQKKELKTQKPTYLIQSEHFFNFIPTLHSSCSRTTKNWRNQQKMMILSPRSVREGHYFASVSRIEASLHECLYWAFLTSQHDRVIYYHKSKVPVDEEEGLVRLVHSLT
jgi:hypothetical protein